MIIRRTQAPSAPRSCTLNIGRGVTLHARALNAFEQDVLAADVNYDLDAIAAGGDRLPRREWGFTDEQVARLREDADLRRVLFGAMLAVARATAAVERIEGVQEEDGAEAQPSHEFFVWLLSDASFEAQFRLQSLQLDTLWVAEKKDLGSEQNGSGAAASTSAQAVAPSNAPALTADSSMPTTETLAPSADSAPSSNTNLEAPLAPRPGP